MPGGAMPSGVKAIGRYARWKGSPCRNPEKLANADGRCWKDTLWRKRSFKTHRPPYPTRRGLVTAWQETKKLLHQVTCQIWMDNVREDLKEKNIRKLQGLVKRPKKQKKKSGGVL